MDRIQIVYLLCLAALTLGMGAELWPALQGHAVDLGGVLRVVVAMSVTALLMTLRGRRKQR